MYLTSVISFINVIFYKRSINLYTITFETPVIISENNFQNNLNVIYQQLTLLCPLTIIRKYLPPSSSSSHIFSVCLQSYHVISTIQVTVDAITRNDLRTDDGFQGCYTSYNPVHYQHDLSFILVKHLYSYFILF